MSDGLNKYVTLSHLRSKEISIHKPCIPHFTDSRATTKCKPVYIHSDVAWESGAHQTCTTL